MAQPDNYKIKRLKTPFIAVNGINQAFWIATPITRKRSETLLPQATISK
jgi:hypothetical protein